MKDCIYDGWFEHGIEKRMGKWMLCLKFSKMFKRNAILLYEHEKDFQQNS